MKVWVGGWVDKRERLGERETERGREGGREGGTKSEHSLSRT